MLFPNNSYFYVNYFQLLSYSLIICYLLECLCPQEISWKLFLTVLLHDYSWRFPLGLAPMPMRLLFYVAIRGAVWKVITSIIMTEIRWLGEMLSQLGLWTLMKCHLVNVF